VHNRFFQQHLQCDRLLLASTRLRLIHPVSRQPLVIDAQLDKRFQHVLATFKWQAFCPGSPIHSAQTPHREI
jgi:tRNA pseudouridine65 synthase